ncbi:MAG: AAA family ATPase, partial [Armatimonadota bacterium]|nr:AAA family ATPase [Armatimonadota bacterium]
MLKRIHIKGYKSLVDVCFELKPLSILFGPNAAGKSNFLDALQLLSRLATSQTLKEAFEPPYRGTPLESLTFGPDGLKGLLSQERASFSIEADIQLSDSVKNLVNEQIRVMKTTHSSNGEPAAEGGNGTLSSVRERFLRYRIEIEIIPKLGFLRVVDEYLAAINAVGQVTNKRKPFLEKVGDRLHLRMEGQAHPTYHELYLDRSILSFSLYTPHYPHIVAMKEELRRWLFFYFEPRERMRASNPVKEVRHIGHMGEELPAFLNTLKALSPAQFRAVEKALHMIVPSVTGIDVGVSDVGEVELRLLEGQVAIPARVVSEGTLRILGLLALQGAKESPGLLGFEEPENGVHPRRIEMIANNLKTRAVGPTQIIATTHSPVLLNLIPTKHLFVCQKRGGRTD